MRCFVSIELNDELKQKIIQIQKRIRGDIKRVERENLHICLKFLGEVEKDRIPPICESLKEIGKIIDSFKISVGKMGGFPNLRRPRVVWIGAKGDFSIQKVLEAKMEILGFPVEKREFTPHITLGRVKFGRVELPETGFLGELEVKQIHLIASELTPQGPIYSKICSVELQ